MEKTTKKTETKKSVDVAKVAAKSAPKKVAKRRAPLAHGVGRRKKAVARVWLCPGTGAMIVNDRDYAQYFDTDYARFQACEPLGVIKEAEGYDISVNVYGGGIPAQADAVKLGIARALVTLNEQWRPMLRKAGLLTVDDRQKERKKYGQRGARRKFQFVKR
jgi:small subunit ribosomal protein S9